MKDQEFISYFGIILAGLVMIAVIIFIIATMLSEGQLETDAALVRATEERIKPISQVNVGEVAAAIETETPAMMGEVNMPPEAIYQSVCQACHLSGVLESPKLTDKTAWLTRIKERDLNAMYQSAIAGRGNMPAKAGRADLSDDAIKATVDYMLEQAGVSY